MVLQNNFYEMGKFVLIYVVMMLILCFLVV